MTFQHLPVNSLTPSEKNPRHITESELEKLAQSLKEDPLYFETRPVICSNRTGTLVIIAGEKRWMAAQQLGWETVPTAILSGLTEADERRILVKDNGSFGWWDWEQFQQWGFAELPVSDWGVLVPFETLPDLTDNEHYTLKEPQAQLTKPEVKEYRVKCPACGFWFKPDVVQDPQDTEEDDNAVQEQG